MIAALTIYVKPFDKRQENDAAGAAVIAEGVLRPNQQAAAAAPQTLR